MPPVNPSPIPCIVALDYPSRDELLGFMKSVTPQSVPWVKIGLQSICLNGPGLVREVGAAGFKIFLDLKLHDIPNTVAGAVRSLSSLPISMLTLHASGGLEMMQRALDIQQELAPDLRLLGVTVLTSMDRKGLAETGITNAPDAHVERLASLALEAGMPGLVCSPLELRNLRQEFGKNPFLVTPGVRPAGGDMGDQKRTMTPAEAVQAGASALVVGRPITKAADPVAAVKGIQEEMSLAIQ